jgi:hypothetical protein
MGKWKKQTKRDMNNHWMIPYTCRIGEWNKFIYKVFRTTQETFLSIFNYSNGLWEKKIKYSNLVYEKKIKKWNANGCKWREWQQTQMDDNTSHGPAIFFYYKFLVGISIVQSWIWTLVFHIISNHYTVNVVLKVR